MADPEVVVDVNEDEEMQTVPDITADEGAGDNEPTGLEDIEPTVAERVGFIEYAPSRLKLPERA